MNCEYSQQVHAYHDGQLSAEKHQQVEIHLSRCSLCQNELRELQQLSRMFDRNSLPIPSDEMLARLHQRVDIERETGLLHIAEWMTGTAAAVLFLGLIGLLAGQSASASPGQWEQSAVTLQADAPTNGDAQIAHWMTTEFSTKNANDL